MQARIHRGTQEVGGSCIELEASGGLVAQPLVASKVRRIACLRTNLTPSGLRFASEFEFEGD